MKTLLKTTPWALLITGTLLPGPYGDILALTALTILTVTAWSRGERFEAVALGLLAASLVLALIGVTPGLVALVLFIGVMMLVADVGYAKGQRDAYRDARLLMAQRNEMRRARDAAEGRYFRD